MTNMRCAYLPTYLPTSRFKKRITKWIWHTKIDLVTYKSYGKCWGKFPNNPVLWWLYNDDDDYVGKRQTASKQDGMRCDGGHEWGSRSPAAALFTDIFCPPPPPPPPSIYWPNVPPLPPRSTWSTLYCCWPTTKLLPFYPEPQCGVKLFNLLPFCRLPSCFSFFLCPLC